MSEKPLCGHCYNECTDNCCDKRKIDVLKRQLAEARDENERLKNQMNFILVHPDKTEIKVSLTREQILRYCDEEVYDQATKDFCECVDYSEYDEGCDCYEYTGECDIIKKAEMKLKEKD